MKDFIFGLMIVLNIVFVFVIRYENRIYNDEFKRAEYCRKVCHEYIDKHTKLQYETRNYVRR